MQKITIRINDSEKESSSAPTGFLEKVTFALLLSLPFLLPVFFVPSANFPLQFSKMLLLSIFVLIAFACWILARLKDGKFVFPAHVISISAFAVVVISAISAVTSGASRWALVGQNLDVGTVSSLAVLFLMMFLVPIVFRSKDHIFYAYLAFFISFFLIAIFHILRIFKGADFLSLGIFTDITSNTIGKWNDLGVFFGIGSVLSLVTLELVSLSRLFQIVLYIALVTSLFFLAIINFVLVWWVLAIFSLIFLVYIISFDKSEKTASELNRPEQNSYRRTPITSLTVLLISLIFILGGNTISDSISGKLHIFQLDVRPSWSSTFDIAKSVLKSDPAFGAGPNRFVEQWLMFKPDGINTTAFWNTDFNFGIGFVPTFLITTGLLGAISWIVFLGLFLSSGFKSVLSPVKDRVSRYLLVSSFLTSLFLWVMNIFYVPDLPMMAFTFFFSGLFIASMNESKIRTHVVISFSDDPKKSFVSVLCLVMLLIGTISLAYSFTEKYIASVYFQQGLVSYGREGNVDKAEVYLLKAVSLDGTAMYYRTLAQADMLKLSTLLSQDSKAVSADTVRAKFQVLLSSALGYANQAVAIDKTDYQNWNSLGQVYEAVVPLKIANAYESAVNAYKQSLSLNPKSPAILLTLARLEATHGDNTKAKDFIRQALEQRNTYTEAIFLLAQIQASEGNIKDAIDSVQAASYLAPNDSGVFFQLGLLRYTNKDYKGASGALEQALVINNGYANAKYFLGLSYYQIGRVADSIKLFQDLKNSNPDNQEIDLILKNLKAGSSPFANAKPPIDNKPEKRVSPPVSEKSTKRAI